MISTSELYEIRSVSPSASNRIKADYRKGNLLGVSDTLARESTRLKTAADLAGDKIRPELKEKLIRFSGINLSASTNILKRATKGIESPPYLGPDRRKANLPRVKRKVA